MGMLMMEFSICWLTNPPLPPPTHGKFFRDFLLHSVQLVSLHLGGKQTKSFQFTQPNLWTIPYVRGWLRELGELFNKARNIKSENATNEVDSRTNNIEDILWPVTSTCKELCYKQCSQYLL